MVAALAVIISNYITYWTGWKTLSMLLPIVLGGIFVMLLFNRWQVRKTFSLHFKSVAWLIPKYLTNNLSNHFQNYSIITII